MPHAIRRIDIAGRCVDWSDVQGFCLNVVGCNRDVTDYLQLLLRKSGHHLHTSAEREVVRTIKEKCCFVALSTAKEEKESLSRAEEFILPDGNIVQVCCFPTLFRII
jgi:centractin